MADEKKIQTRNRMSVKALRSNNNNNDVEVFESSKTPGRCFFTCGDATGYMTKKAAQQWNSGNHKGSTYEYMEIFSEKDNKWIPCMVIKGNGPAKSLGSMED